MPEGDSIHRLAARLGPVLVGREVTAFQARAIDDIDTRSVVGKRVVSVSARGKNLLVAFDDGRALHVHLRMVGRMFVERPRSAFYAPARGLPDLRLAVAGGGAVIGRRLAICRLLTPGQQKWAPDLASLGPDLIDDRFDEDEALARLRAEGPRAIAEALLLQRALAGIGNVYKSEVLFLEGIDPHTPTSRVDDARLRAIIRRARTLLRANVRPGPRTTRPALAGPRVWVYARGGRACLRCGTTIVRTMQAGRSTYFCPRCQAAAPRVEAR